MYATHCSANCKALNQTVFSHASSELWRQAQTAQQRLNDYITRFCDVIQHTSSHQCWSLSATNTTSSSCLPKKSTSPAWYLQPPTTPNVFGKQSINSYTANPLHHFPPPLLALHFRQLCFLFHRQNIQTPAYHSTSHPAEKKSSLKGAWSWSNNPFQNFTPHAISWLDYDANSTKKKYQVCCMSIEIFASKFPNIIIVMESYKRLTITLLYVSCMLVSCVRISEQGEWCWWLTGTGTEFRFR